MAITFTGSASEIRTNLGLGSAATLDAGTSANNLLQLDGSGNLPAVGAGLLTGVNGGKIKQVVSTTQATRVPYSSTTESTLISTTITPTATNSKIWVTFYDGDVILSNTGLTLYCTFKRGTTNLTNTNRNEAASGLRFPMIGHCIDEPSTTSAVTYNFTISCQSGLSVAFGHATSDQTKRHLVCVEIGA